MESLENKLLVIATFIVESTTHGHHENNEEHSHLVNYLFVANAYIQFSEARVAFATIHWIFTKIPPRTFTQYTTFLKISTGY